MTETIPLSATVGDRQTVPANPTLHIPEDVIRSNSVSSKDWHDAQNQDPNISQVADKLNKGTILAQPMNRELKAYLKELPNIVSIQGVLYKKTRTPGEERLQLLIPENLRCEVFHALHTDLGHQGRDLLRLCSRSVSIGHD
ncbi:hypothetical protein DPMN_081203 [Dreissena polymorpha]|uniref:Integrase zinc-binding domain-containing protein n=1 Tax=Dreissena polymorpha TaxID=45954 RepID=A0A9D3Y4N5_DREPO|nr:hypothetical protein DPMN_081203 [Dreissena polymorpha]